MRNPRFALALGALTLASGLSSSLAFATGQSAAGTAQSLVALTDIEDVVVYRSGVILSLDPVNRMLVLKGRDGREETLSFASTLTGVGEVQAADRVTVTLRGNPGQIVAIVRDEANQVSSGPTPLGRPSPNTAQVRAARARGPARDAFASRVATLAREASLVDRAWSDLRRTCAVTASRRYEGGREWFGLWENQIRVDVSTTPCIDLFNKVVGLGQAVVSGMASAQEEIRASDVLPGDLRKIRLRHSLDWDGWDRPAPDHIER